MRPDPTAQFAGGGTAKPNPPGGRTARPDLPGRRVSGLDLPGDRVAGLGLLGNRVAETDPAGGHAGEPDPPGRTIVQAGAGTVRATDHLRLTIIGPAAAWSRQAGRASSCYLVEHGSDALVLDLGQGSFSGLAARREPATLRAVLISHVHPDHCVDLVPLRHYLKFGAAAPSSVMLRAPADLRRRFDAFYAEENFLECMPGEPLEVGTFRIGPFEVTAGHVLHIEDSYAFRVAVAGARDVTGGAAGGESGAPEVTRAAAAGEDGDSSRLPGLVYSGDCGRFEDLLPLLRPGDTLLSEAAFGAGPCIDGPNHINAALAAQAAVEGEAGRLVITHLLDGVDPRAALRAARVVYGGPVLLAKPGLPLTID